MTNPIDAVRARLDGGRLWQQDALGEYDLPNTPLCLKGGCEAASLARLPARVIAYVIGEVVGEQYPDRSYQDGDGDWVVEAFNDHPDTTWADVELVLEKASVRWDETHV